MKKTKDFFVFSLFASVLVLTVETSARAGTVFFDSTAGFPPTGGVLSQPITSGQGSPSASFSTLPSTGSYTLTDLKLGLSTSDGSSGSAAVTLTVNLLSDDTSGGFSLPGAYLATLGTIDESQISDPALHDFQLNGPVVLAGTRYWIQLSESVGSNVVWDQTTDTSGQGVSSEFWAMGSNLSQNDDGFGNGIPFVMKIEGVTAVPEASALVVWSVMFSVVAAVWSLQRLKQAAAAA